MSMPIQRQSEQFAAFDTGTQWARDRGNRELPKGLAALVNSMGPRVGSGMLNTRTAGTDFHNMEIDDVQDLSDSGHPGAQSYLEKFYEKPEGYFTDENYSGPGVPDRANNPRQAGLLNTREAGMHSGAKTAPGADGGSSTSGDYVDVPGLYDGSDHPSYFEPGGVGNESWDSWEPGPSLPGVGGKTGGMHYPDEYDPRVDGYPEEDYRKDSYDGEWPDLPPSRESYDDEDDWNGPPPPSDRFVSENDIPFRDREARRGSGRHPFELTAGWADDNPAFDDVMKHIDDQLAGGEKDGEDYYFNDDYLDGPHPGALPRPGLLNREYDESCAHCGADSTTDEDGYCNECGHQHAPEELSPDAATHRQERYEGPPFAGAGCDHCGGHHSEPFEVNDVSVGDDYKGKFCDDCIHKLMPSWYGHRSSRLAGWADDNPDFDDVMKHIDEQLAAGEQGSDRQVFRDPRFNGDNGHRRDPNQELAERGFSTGPGDAMRVAWEGKACPDCAMAIANGDDSGASEGWSWDNMQSGINSLPGDGDVHLNCNEDDDCDSNFQRGPCDLCGNPDAGTFHPVVSLEYNHRHAAAPAVDPAAQQQMVVPPAGGLQPGHRIGLPWRGNTIRGTVIGLDGNDAAVRWDDGQYSSEEPRNIHLL